MGEEWIRDGKPLQLSQDTETPRGRWTTALEIALDPSSSSWSYRGRDGEGRLERERDVGEYNPCCHR